MLFSETISKILKIKYPIMQAPMFGVSEFVNLWVGQSIVDYSELSTQNVLEQLIWECPH